MKKTYENIQVEVVMFATKDVVVASGASIDEAPYYVREENEMEIL